MKNVSWVSLRILVGNHTEGSSILRGEYGTDEIFDIINIKL